LSTITNNATGAAGKAEANVATETAAASAASRGVARRVAAPGSGGARRPPVLAVVVPCLDEEAAVSEAAVRLSALLASLIAAGRIDAGSFVYFVDDGSRDGTWAAIEELHRGGGAIKGLRLARNFGAQNALLAGMLSVRERADCVVTIDADLQQDERAVDQFLDAHARGAQIVYGVRRNYATDSVIKRAASSAFYNLMRLMDARIIKHHSEYRLVSRKALDAVAEYPEYNVFLRGIFVDIGYPSEIVTFDVRRRAAGRSKHGLRKLAGLALDGVTSFSVVPLRLVTFVGALVFLFSCAMSLFYLWQRVRGNSAPGWAASAIPVYFLGGVQIMFLGLVGEYVGKIYKEVKARPRYIRDEELF
jgi:glycosyltransferase involved in cell wall biosynthesis